MFNEMNLCDDIGFWLERKVPDLDKTTIKCKCIGSHKRLYLEWMLEHEMFGCLGSELHIQTKKVEIELKDLCSSLLRPIKVTSNGLEIRDIDNQELILILLVRLSVIYALKWKLGECNENSIKKLELDFSGVNYEPLEDIDWNESDDLNLLRGIVKYGLYEFEEILKSSLFEESKFQKKFIESLKKKEENEYLKFLKKRTVFLLISIYMEFYNSNKDYLINGILPLLELKKLKDIPIDMKFSFLYNSSNNISDNNNLNKKPRRSSSNNTLSSSTTNTTSTIDSSLSNSNILLNLSNPSIITVNSNNLSNDDEINTVCLPFHNITKNVTPLDFSKNDPLNPINPISLATSIASQSSLATNNPNITVNSLRKSNKRKYADQFFYCNGNNNIITTTTTINNNNNNNNNNLNQQINSNQSKISQVVKVPGARSQNIYSNNNNNLSTQFNVQMTKRMRSNGNGNGNGNGIDDYDYDYSIPTTTSATVTTSLNNNTNPTSQLMQTSTNPPSYVYTTPTPKFMYPTPINGMISSTIPTMSIRSPNQMYFPYNYVAYQYPYYQPDIFSIMDPNFGNYSQPYTPNESNLQQQQQSPPPPP